MQAHCVHFDVSRSIDTQYRGLASRELLAEISPTVQKTSAGLRQSYLRIGSCHESLGEFPFHSLSRGERRFSLHKKFLFEKAVLPFPRMGLFIKAVLIFSLMAAGIPGAELGGIWTGLAPGRHGKKEDVAFQFKMKGRILTGKMFGDEFDLPIEDASLSGDKVQFSVTATNYYSGAKTRFVYTGTIGGDSMELTRERILAAGEKPPEHENVKQTFTLKKLIP
jgi:hypothetical protein